MKFQHVGCGGEIDVKKRQCTKCKHKWGRITFLTTPNEIRAIPEKVRPKALRQKTYQPTQHAKWAEKVPGATILPQFLPKWPRWARILSTACFVLIVVLIILWIWGVL